MMCFTMVFEDQTIHASLEKDGWIFEVCDMQTGKTQKLTLTNEQAGAVLALMIGGEGNYSDMLTSELYNFAEPVFDGVEPEFRLIP